MNDRQKKLIKARKAARNREKPTEVKSPRLELKAQEKFTAEITQRLDTLCKLVGEQNHDAVIDRLAKLEVVSDQLNTLNSTINKLYGKKLQITNLKELAGHIKTEKVVIPDNKEFFNKFFEQMQGIEEKLKPNQDPTEFLPIRRVRKIGNRLQFDDDTWAGGGSSGGSSSSGGGEVTQGTDPWIVSASSLPLPSGAATSAKQDTQQTALDAIKTAAEILDNIVSGSEAQVDVVGALPAGTNNIGGVFGAASASVTGLDTFRNAALSNTDVAVKASAGRVHGYNFFNPGTALAYVHFYDLATADVTVGTTTPKLSIALPSSATAQVGVDTGLGGPPITFATAITVAASTTPGGGTAPGTAIVANIFYI